MKAQDAKYMWATEFFKLDYPGFTSVRNFSEHLLVNTKVHTIHLKC